MLSRRWVAPALAGAGLLVCAPAAVYVFKDERTERCRRVRGWLGLDVEDAKQHVLSEKLQEIALQEQDGLLPEAARKLTTTRLRRRQRPSVTLLSPVRLARECPGDVALARAHAPSREAADGRFSDAELMRYAIAAGYSPSASDEERAIALRAGAAAARRTEAWLGVAQATGDYWASDEAIERWRDYVYWEEEVEVTQAWVREEGEEEEREREEEEAREARDEAAGLARWAPEGGDAGARGGALGRASPGALSSAPSPSPPGTPPSIPPPRVLYGGSRGDPSKPHRALGLEGMGGERLLPGEVDDGPRRGAEAREVARLPTAGGTGPMSAHEYGRVVVTMIQRAVEAGQLPQEPSLDVVVDVGHVSSLRAARVLGTIREVASALNKHFPSRLARLQLVDLPPMLSYMASAIKRVMHPRTRSKIVVVNDRIAEREGGSIA